MIRRVLIVQPYGIGDLLFITPVLRALRLIPTVNKVDILIGSRTRSIIEANPHIDEIYVIDKDQMHSRSTGGNFKFLSQLGNKLKQNQYDLLLDYSIRGEYAFWSQFYLGIPKRAGYAYKKRGFFHNLHIPIPEGFQGRHVVDFACDLAEKADVPVKNRFVEFFFSETERKALESLTSRLPENYFALSLGGGESWGKDAHLKRWPVEKFVKFSEYLLKKKVAEKIVLVGSAGEKSLAEEFLKTGLPVEDYVGKLSIVETAWALKHSKLFVGNDGGLLHLARAVFKPVIGVYGPADPTVYGPYQDPKSVILYQPPTDGKPRYHKFRYNPQDHSLQDLSVEAAVEMIERRGVLN